MCPTMTVSLLRHNSNYGDYSQGKQRLKRCVLRRLRWTDSDDADDMLRQSKGDRKGTVTDINRE